MEIIQTTSITLSEVEKKALQTIVDAYQTCVINDCFECAECPLLVDNKYCLGQLCDHVKGR